MAFLEVHMDLRMREVILILLLVLTVVQLHMLQHNLTLTVLT